MPVDKLWITRSHSVAEPWKSYVQNGVNVLQKVQFHGFQSYPQAAVSLWITFEFG